MAFDGSSFTAIETGDVLATVEEPVAYILMSAWEDNGSVLVVANREMMDTQLIMARCSLAEARCEPVPVEGRENGQIDDVPVLEGAPKWH